MDDEDYRNPPISLEGLTQILKAYVCEEQRLPSNAVIAELALASGKSSEYVRQLYSAVFQRAGGEGDPWDMPRC